MSYFLLLNFLLWLAWSHVWASAKATPHLLIHPLSWLHGVLFEIKKCPCHFPDQKSQCVIHTYRKEVILFSIIFTFLQHQTITVIIYCHINSTELQFQCILWCFLNFSLSMPLPYLDSFCSICLEWPFPTLLPENVLILQPRRQIPLSHSLGKFPFHILTLCLIHITEFIIIWHICLLNILFLSSTQ